MLSMLLLGLIIGMRHALEADHVAAVASLATGSRSVRHTVTQGAVWGVGHTLTLFLFGGAVLLLGVAVPERLAQFLELAVGLMLVALGADVLRRLARSRIHFHAHRHGDHTHLHAHSHRGDPAPHRRESHPHVHPAGEGFPLRALFVGMMHGMAGSAALIVLTLQTVYSPLQGLAYIALFGLGSVAGMAMLSLTIAIPLHYSARALTWAHNGLSAAVGLLTLGLGAYVVYEIAVVRGLLV